MIKSMTAYGRGENSSDDIKFVIEIKSVNHRYNDISIKLPRSMIFLEDKVRKIISKNVSRGKIDVYVNFEMLSNNNFSLNLNEELAEAYINKINILKEKFFLNTDNILSLIMNFPDIITIEKFNYEEEEIWKFINIALEEAILKFIDMRIKEGEILKLDILNKVIRIRKILLDIKNRAPIVVLEYKDKLELRIKEITQKIDIDEQRLAIEIAIFADRSCIDEEIIRLESHIMQLNNIICEGGLVGRKLDFLVQEMNRETNTIASKSNDIEITQMTIELKSEIEKIREQVQNIE